MDAWMMMNVCFREINERETKNTVLEYSNMEQRKDHKMKFAKIKYV